MLSFGTRDGAPFLLSRAQQDPEEAGASHRARLPPAVVSVACRSRPSEPACNSKRVYAIDALSEYDASYTLR